MNKDTFVEWLKTYANIKPYSIGRYSNAIDTISSELGSYGLQGIDLYSLTDTVYIDEILSNPVFNKKNGKGHRMYSVALNHLKKYIEYYLDTEFQAELLKEEQEFEKYLTEKPVDVSNGDDEDKPKDKPNYKSVNNKKVWSRNPKNASEVVTASDYLCEFDNNHQHFISKFTKKNYVEAHHLIPMSYQDNFDFSLDIHANIVSICLCCHKKLHYGLLGDKIEILNKLYNSRRERLVKCGINISLDELLKYYQDKK